MKLYLDNTVIVDHSLPNVDPKGKQMADKIMSECQSGANIGVISDLTLLELAGTCQKFAYEDIRQNQQINEEQCMNFVRDKGRVIYSDAIKILLKMPYIKLESVMNLKFQDIVSDAIDVMKETTGRKKRFSGYFAFSRAYTVDILHVLLAKHVKCDEFHTSDVAIKKLEEHPKIDPLKIVLH